jgi:hypothetical protein
LQGSFRSRLWAGGVGFEVINPKRFQRNKSGGAVFGGISGILDRLGGLSSPHALRCREFVTDAARSRGLSDSASISEFRLKSSHNHKPFSSRYLPLGTVFWQLPERTCPNGGS